MNGTTKGGLAYTYLEVEIVESLKYAVRGSLKGSGTLVTMFADA